MNSTYMTQTGFSLKDRVFPREINNDGVFTSSRISFFNFEGMFDNLL